MRKLSTGEWRLFLLSDCIKYYKDINEYTAALRKEGRTAVLQLTGEDTKHLDNFLDDTDAKAIRGMLRKEWFFTGKVRDRGAHNLTTCEYCQKQQIRYEYWCKSRVTGVELALGSVCVGYVVYGEERMKDKDFANDVVNKLDKLRSGAVQPKPDVEQRRSEQFPKVQLYINYLRGKGITRDNSEFLKGMSDWWLAGKYYSDKQMTALENMCKKIKYGNNVK